MNEKLIKDAYHASESNPEEAYILFKKIAEDTSLDHKIRSQAFCGASETIFIHAPYIGEADLGYSCILKAIDIDQENYYARTQFCLLYFSVSGKTYISEVEFIKNLLFLIEKSRNIEKNDVIYKRIEVCIKNYLNEKLKSLGADV